MRNANALHAASPTAQTACTRPASSCAPPLLATRGWRQHQRGQQQHGAQQQQQQRLGRSALAAGSRGRGAARVAPMLPPLRAAPKWNPQNTENPLVVPDPALSPEDAVKAQLDALGTNDDPWPNHGIQTAYEFGLDIGGLDPCCYFGFRKDLYHLDHFMGVLSSTHPGLVNHGGYALLGTEEDGDARIVKVEVMDAQGGVEAYAFKLKIKDIGRKKGSWMTYSLTKS